MSGPRFFLPEAKRASPWWTVASFVVHVAIAVVLVSVAGPSFRWTPSDETTVFTTLLPPDGTPADREFAMPGYVGTPEGVLTAGGEGGRFMGVLPSPRIDSVLPPRAPAFLIAQNAHKWGDAASPGDKHQILAIDQGLMIEAPCRACGSKTISDLRLGD